jgi:DNA-binding transcriptional ArsR family regulator
LALLDLSYNAKLTREERGRRFADCCEKAIVSFYRNERVAAALADTGKTSAKTLEPAMLVRDEAEREIVRYLGRVGTATPLDFCKALGIPRPTVTRKLRRLRSTGIVVVSGKTQAARYCLRGNADAN